MHGLFKGHAYSVIQFAETSDRTGFVRVRNPWGNEAEWKGRYGDGTRDWDRNPLHKRELNPEFKDDGAFWMTWEDFRTIFTDIDVVRFFPYTWCVLSMVGRASKKENTEKNTFIFKVEAPPPPQKVVPEMLYRIASSLSSSSSGMTADGRALFWLRGAEVSPASSEAARRKCHVPPSERAPEGPLGTVLVQAPSSSGCVHTVCLPARHSATGALWAVGTVPGGRGGVQGGISASYILCDSFVHNWFGGFVDLHGDTSAVPVLTCTMRGGPCIICSLIF